MLRGDPRPLVSVYRRRMLGMNKAAKEAIGNPRWVRLWVDMGTGVFKIEPLSAESSDGWSVGSSGVVGCRSLVGVLGLVAGKRFVADVEDGCLVVTP